MSKLIEKLKEFSSEYFDKYAHTKDRDDIVKSATFDKCIDIVKQHSDWVSDDEQMPDNGVFVLVYLKSGHMEILQRNEYEHTDDDNSVIWEKMCCNGYFTDWDILAWQPLPKPPSEVKP